MAAPGGYYAGAPAAPPPAEPADSQHVNASVPGYYNGGPAAAKAGATAGGQGGSPSKESGFFASCCACFSGGPTAK